MSPPVTHSQPAAKLPITGPKSLSIYMGAVFRGEIPYHPKNVRRFLQEFSLRLCTIRKKDARE